MTQQKLVHDRHFYKIFTGLVLSLALQNLLTYSVNLADNLMIGAYSQNALSGISLCNQIQFLLQMMVVGVGEGVVVLGSQYWGKRQLEPIPHIIGSALRFGVGMSAVLFIAALLFPSQILGLLNNDADVLAEGVAYLRIICFTYVVFALTNMLTASLRSIGIVKIGLHRYGFHAVHQYRAQFTADLWPFWLSRAGRARRGDCHRYGADCRKCFVIVIFVIKKHDVSLSFKHFKLKKTIFSLFA